MEFPLLARLHRCGYRVLILECEKPSAIRRKVAFCEAVYDGTAAVEGILCRRIDSLEECEQVWLAGEIPLMVDPAGNCIIELSAQGKIATAMQSVDHAACQVSAAADYYTLVTHTFFLPIFNILEKAGKSPPSDIFVL